MKLVKNLGLIFFLLGTKILGKTSASTQNIKLCTNSKTTNNFIKNLSKIIPNSKQTCEASTLINLSSKLVESYFEKDQKNQNELTIFPANKRENAKKQENFLWDIETIDEDVNRRFFNEFSNFLITSRDILRGDNYTESLVNELYVSGSKLFSTVNGYIYELVGDQQIELPQCYKNKLRDGLHERSTNSYTKMPSNPYCTTKDFLNWYDHKILKNLAKIINTDKFLNFVDQMIEDIRPLAEEILDPEFTNNGGNNNQPFENSVREKLIPNIEKIQVNFLNFIEPYFLNLFELNHENIEKFEKLFSTRLNIFPVFNSKNLNLMKIINSQIFKDHFKNSRSYEKELSRNIWAYGMEKFVQMLPFVGLETSGTDPRSKNSISSKANSLRIFLTNRYNKDLLPSDDLNLLKKGINNNIWMMLKIDPYQRLIQKFFKWLELSESRELVEVLEGKQNYDMVFNDILVTNANLKLIRSCVELCRY